MVHLNEYHQRIKGGRAMITYSKYLLSIALFFVTDCTKEAATQVAKTAADLNNTVCQVMSDNQQTEPDWLKIECTLANGASAILRTFSYRIPSSDGRLMYMRRPLPVQPATLLTAADASAPSLDAGF